MDKHKFGVNLVISCGLIMFSSNSFQYVGQDALEGELYPLGDCPPVAGFEIQEKYGRKYGLLAIYFYSGRYGGDSDKNNIASSH